MAVSRWIEHQTGWSIRRLVKTARRYRTIQIQAGPISADRQNDADIPTMIGASATLLLAKVPFHGPIGAVRLARVDEKLVPFPTAEEMIREDRNR